MANNSNGPGPEGSLEEFYGNYVSSLCGVRVSQMTKTYNDVEAVTRLLEEKERDLEIAARIGQSLLEKNRDIQEKNESLEDDVRHALEQVNQLRHEVSMKDDLLQIYTHDFDGGDSPGEHGRHSLYHLENLQTKVKTLEEDNLHLRAESADLKTETCDYEEKEAQLVKDCVRQLTDANSHVKILADDLNKKTECYLNQQEEITNLLAKVCNLEAKIKKLTIENAEMQSHLQAAQDSQHQLTSEILDLQDKCNEYVELLSSANEEIKTLRTKNHPKAMRYQYGGSPFLPSDSLASELEDSFKKDLDFPLGYSPRERKHHNYKVMETARIARINQKRPKHGLNIPGSNMSTSGNESDVSMRSQHNSLCLSDSESMISEGYQGDTDSVCSNMTPMTNVCIPTRMGMTSSCLSVTAGQTVMSSTIISSTANLGRNANITSSTTNYGNTSFGSHSNQTNGNTRCSTPSASANPGIGKPGIPGSNDLETALRRLTLRHAHDVFERKYRESEDLMRFGSETGSLTPTPCWTPDSLMSTGSCLSGASGPSGGNYTFKIPEKLQIVKPMEGSQTLHQWQRLATPHLGGFLEDRPGVQIKGERKVDLGNDFDNYSITDFEEDDDEDYKYSNVRKCAELTSSTYTYTTAKIMHPTDEYALTTLSSSTGTSSSTPRPTCSLLSPTTESRGATSTFSMNMGLSHTLKERGFHTQTVQLSNPTRVSSIVTETLYDKNRVMPTTIYTTAMTEPTIRVTQSFSHGLPEPPYFGITEKPDWSKLESFANTLSDKIRNIGVDRLFGSSTEDTEYESEATESEKDATESEKEATESEKEATKSETEAPSDTDTKKKPAKPKLTIKLPSGDARYTSPTATPPNSPICATPPTPLTPPNSPIAGAGQNTKSAFSFNFVSPILQIAGLQLRRRSDLGIFGGMAMPNRDPQPSQLFRGLHSGKKS